MIESILIIITTLVPVITAITELVKEIVPNKYRPLIPLVIGLLIGVAAMPLTGGAYTIYQLLWAGGLAGLSSAGFYETSTLNSKNK